MIGAVVGGVVGGALGAYYSYQTTGKVDWKYVLGGAVAGALIGAGLGALAQKLYAVYAVAAPAAGEEVLSTILEADEVIIHQHHSYPVYLGGDVNQITTPMIASEHRALHAGFSRFEGGWLYPKIGYNGKIIIDLHGKINIISGIERYYKDNYPNLLIDFYNAVRFTAEKGK
ncbi:MAG: hypothetical protein KKH92_09335 [Firmicutes bacterium]|nr:hypothetical protein [Bacillota bacterium]